MEWVWEKNQHNLLTFGRLSLVPFFPGTSNPLSLTLTSAFHSKLVLCHWSCYVTCWLLYSFWLCALRMVAQFNFPAVAHVTHRKRQTQRCQAIHKINIWPRVTRHRHLTSWLMLLNFSSFFAAIVSLFDGTGALTHASCFRSLGRSLWVDLFFFNVSHSVHIQFLSVEWWMLMWLFLFRSFFGHIHKIYFHSTICARNNQNFSHLTHFSLFVHVHSSQQSW